MATNPLLLPENSGRITAADANYDYGSAKDDSTGSTGDGTPIKKALMNDRYGFEQAILKAAGIVPSGNAETQLISEYLQGIVEIASGRAFNYDDASVGADTYVFDVRTDQQKIRSLFDGLTLIGTVNFTNTGGAVTVDPAGLGATPVKTLAGNNPNPGALKTDRPNIFKYDATAAVFKLYPIGIDPVPFDNSSATSDATLEVGESCYVDFSAATSVLLHVACGDKQKYEITIATDRIIPSSAGSTAVTLFPNNTTYAATFGFNGLISNGAALTPQGSGTGSGYNAFYLGYFGKPGYVVTSVFTSTNYKAYETKSVNLDNAIVDYFAASGVWYDNTTPYTSLGTLQFGYSLTGRVIIKRVA